MSHFENHCHHQWCSRCVSLHQVSALQQGISHILPHKLVSELLARVICVMICRNIPSNPRNPYMLIGRINDTIDTTLAHVDTLLSKASQSMHTSAPPALAPFEIDSGSNYQDQPQHLPQIHRNTAADLSKCW